VLSAHVIQALHQIVSRRVNPLEPAVVTIGTIHGGTATNIIPDSVELTGTVRAYSEEARDLMLGEIEKVVRLVEPLGGRADVRIERGYPPTVNDAAATAIMQAAVGGLIGDDLVLNAEPVMGAEDFSYMAQAAPGCFLNLGVKNPSWDRIYPVHRADFRIDEDALPLGTASLVAAALHWMETHP
jgi:amidohydrolase